MMSKLQPIRRKTSPISGNSDKEKINKISCESPRMYYTPDEFPIPDEMMAVQLYFRNINVVNPRIDAEGNIGRDIKIFKKTYIRVNFINAKYDWLLVDENQKELFDIMYLNKKEDKKKDKTWI